MEERVRDFEGIMREHNVSEVEDREIFEKIIEIFLELIKDSKP